MSGKLEVGVCLCGLKLFDAALLRAASQERNHMAEVGETWFRAGALYEERADTFHNFFISFSF